MQYINIYIDGACKGNPGRGGWGVYISNIDDIYMEKYYDIWKEKYFLVDRKNLYIKMKGRENSLTTNNKMELQAAIECCKFCMEYNFNNINIYTDSVYVHQGITKWIYGWHKKDRLKVTSLNPVKNIDLWLELESFNQKSFNWFWVKGHSGNIGNDIADELASLD